MKIKFIGGPVDGAAEDVDVTLEKPYFIIGVMNSNKIVFNKKDCPIYCCYKFDGNKANYISSKTYEQMMGGK